MPVAVRDGLVALFAAGGLACALVALSLNWWTVDFRVTDAGGDVALDQNLFEARPYSSQAHGVPGGPAKPFDEALDSDVVLAGVLVTTGGAFLLASAVASVLGLFRPKLSRALVHAPAAAGLLLGVVSVAMAPLLWPAGWDQQVRNEAGAAEPQPSASWVGRDLIGSSHEGHQAYTTYRPGGGWVAAMVGFVALPLASASIGYWPGRRAASPRGRPAPRAPLSSPLAPALARRAASALRPAAPVVAAAPGARSARPSPAPPPPANPKTRPTGGSGRA